MFYKTFKKQKNTKKLIKIAKKVNLFNKNSLYCIKNKILFND